MAACEKCGASGFTPYQMLVDKEHQIFIGPCCSTSTSMPGMKVVPRGLPPEEVEYGIQVSNKVGVHLYVNYGGLALSFDRTPKEIEDWAIKTGIMDKTTSK